MLMRPAPLKTVSTLALATFAQPTTERVVQRKDALLPRPEEAEVEDAAQAPRLFASRLEFGLVRTDAQIEAYLESFV